MTENFGPVTRLSHNKIASLKKINKVNRMVFGGSVITGKNLM